MCQFITVLGPILEQQSIHYFTFKLAMFAEMSRQSLRNIITQLTPRLGNNGMELGYSISVGGTNFIIF